MTLDELKRNLQAFFSDGLVTIVGSGLSCAEGLPSMGDLADELISQVPKKCTPNDLIVWEKIAALLNGGTNLEAAITTHSCSSDLEDIIVEIVAKIVAAAENQVIRECIEAGRELKFSSILPFLSPQHPKVSTIITTNYDRLIEVAAELQNFWVETGFCGKLMGKYDQIQSRHQGATGTSKIRSTVKLTFPNRVILSKPHGSLDWFLRNGEPIYSNLDVSSRPLIITPGNSKYRHGYNKPFDSQRDIGNRAIDVAKAILIIGYGFNDDHLQTHLAQRINAGIPCLVLTRTLTDATRCIIKSSPSVIALSKNDPNGTLITSSSDEFSIDSINMWDIESFTEEVLRS